ncbi:MAG: hypothetical protein LAO19_07820 [Acidobacteriia bacterium]|nr:hypothetical protein [Terriglobia bacterium]
MTSPARKTDHRIFSKTLVFLGLGVAFSFGAASLFAQQNQPGEVQADIEQQNPQEQPPQDQPATIPPGTSQAGPPATLTLPAGTIIRVRSDEWLSSDRNAPGDTFSAVLDQPLVVDGWVVARRGQAETGTVAIAKKAGRGNGTSQLGVQIGELTLVDGQQVPLQTQMLQTTAGTSHGQEAAIVGTTTGVGAAIGAVAEGGSGAAIGAGVGAAAGLIGVLATRGKPTVLAPETVLSFRLQAPVTINTERSQFAFLPVSQGDYDSHSPNGGRQHLTGPRGPAYPPPPYYYGYPYAYPYGFYPGALGFGFYGAYGYGPRFGRFRR